MDAGTIIYFIVILFFAILGFFNKSKKEQQAKNQAEGVPKTPSPGVPTIPEIVRKMQEAKNFWEIEEKKAAPLSKIPPKQKNFIPSVSTITSSIEGQSSLKGSLYVDDSLEGADIVEPSISDMKKQQPVHAFFDDLTREGSQAELRRAVLYAEILNRKF